MKKRNLVKKILATAGASVLATTMLFNGAAPEVANAASEKTNLFNETLSIDSLEDDMYNWTVKDGSTIDVGNIGNPGFGVTGDSFTYQYDSKITLAEGQYVEAVLVFEKMDTTKLDIKLSATKAASGADVKAEEGEGVSMNLLKDGIQGHIYSANTNAAYTNGWTGASNPADNTPGSHVNGWFWVNGNAWLGSADPTAYTLRARIYDNGAAVYSIASAHNNNWWNPLWLGFNHNNWTFTETGYTPMSEGYLQFIFREGGANFLSAASVGVYSYDETKLFDTAANVVGGIAWGAFAEGTLVGTQYVEDFKSVSNSKFQEVDGKAAIVPAIKAIHVDNKADDDVLATQNAIPVPELNYNKDLCDIDVDLVISELAGTAKSVVYLGANSASDMTGAEKVEFGVNEAGAVTLTAGGKTVLAGVEVGEKFNLKADVETDGTIKLAINDKTVQYEVTPASEGVEAVMADVVVNKDLAGKHIAFGTTGVADANKAGIGVAKMTITAYEYKQGTGGDFVEDFNGTYNPTDLTVGGSYTDEDWPVFFQKDEETGDFYFNKVGYDGVLGTQQKYGDFEWTVELNNFKSATVPGKDEQGNDVEKVYGSHFQLHWGILAAGTTYTSGAGFMFIDNAIVFRSYVEKVISTPDMFPKGDGFTTNIFEYDFSQGDVVCKVVKEGTNVSLYVYFENSPEDFKYRTTPLFTFDADYSYGHLAICGVPTNGLMDMVVEKFAVKNLDVHKAENLIVGADADRKDLDFTVEVESDSIPDLTESTPAESTPAESAPATSTDDKGGCNGVIGSVAALSALTGLAFISLRKRNND